MLKACVTPAAAVAAAASVFRRAAASRAVTIPRPSSSSSPPPPPRRGRRPATTMATASSEGAGSASAKTERVYPEECRVEVNGKQYRRCAAALVFNKNGDVLVGERSDRPGSWGMPQGGIEVRDDRSNDFLDGFFLSVPSRPRGRRPPTARRPRPIFHPRTAPRPPSHAPYLTTPRATR
jgi:hypothetical protein